MFDNRKFKAMAAEKGLTMEQIANDLGINPATLSRKVNGASDFTRNEIQAIKMKYGLTSETIEAIFFAD